MSLLLTFALVVQRIANRWVCEAGSERRQQQDQGQQQEPLYASESVEVGSTTCQASRAWYMCYSLPNEYIFCLKGPASARANSPCNLSYWLKGSIDVYLLSNRLSTSSQPVH